jgi:hypothetical protein
MADNPPDRAPNGGEADGNGSAEMGGLILSLVLVNTGEDVVGAAITPEGVVHVTDCCRVHALANVVNVITADWGEEAPAKVAAAILDAHDRDMAAVVVVPG